MSSTNKTINIKTVAALVTPLNEGGIGVIQVTGPSALKIVNPIFRSKNIKNLEQSQNNKLYYGTIHDGNNNQIDEVIINVCRNASSRGRPQEDIIVEINCHGGIYLVKRILDLVVAGGAQRIEWQGAAGRLVGLKMNHWPMLDLIQDESLLELPNTKTKLGSKVILDQYMGALSSSMANLIEMIEGLQHFFDQARTDTNLSKCNPDISATVFEINMLLSTFRFGKAITRPQNIIIIGNPNVGKSTLINRLLGKDRVVVHDEPGTTRDPISELISIKGIPFNLIDTAGIRETDHIIEKKGIEITHELMLKADKIILMFDSSAPLGKDDLDMFNLVCSRIKVGNSMEYSTSNRKTHRVMNMIIPQLIPVVSKTDMPAMITKDHIINLLRPVRDYLVAKDIIKISAVK
ncbi:MAG: GTPase, partial [Calditrichia bacterium]